MAIALQTPFPMFVDTDGSPLDGGYILIGVSGLNPISNPQQAYWDESLTIPATNVRTSGGFIVNNGAPSSLYMAGDFSLLVKNKNGAIIYSKLAISIDNAYLYLTLPRGTLSRAALIPPSFNMNLIIDSGYYSWTNALTVNNPAGTAAADLFVMSVIASPDGAGLIQQTLFDLSNGSAGAYKFYRQSTDAGINWDAWVYEYSLTSDQIDALAGTDGAPSAANPFVTESDKVNFTTHDDTLSGVGSVADPLRVQLLVKTLTAQVFNTAGANTWTKPANCKKITMLLIGAGGGGGAGDSDGAGNGGGGGSGGVLCVTRDVSAVASIAFTLGAAGTAGSTGSGGAGGASTFGGFTINGGAGGEGGNSGNTTHFGGAGGTVTGTDAEYTLILAKQGGSGGNGNNGALSGGGGGGAFENGESGYSSTIPTLGGSNTPSGLISLGVNPKLLPPISGRAGSGNIVTTNAPARTADNIVTEVSISTTYVLGGGGGTIASASAQYDGYAGSKAIAIFYEYY